MPIQAMLLDISSPHILQTNVLMPLKMIVGNGAANGTSR
jgi:hypothetical protein